ncbi:MAG: hypothetical protein ACI81R_003318, partial [Bradymonadia bacterium]
AVSMKPRSKRSTELSGTPCHMEAARVVSPVPFPVSKIFHARI